MSQSRVFSERYLEKIKILALCFGGLLICSAVHFYALDQAPGFHFDEAWAANHAYRLAFEPGFWPFFAQSPYAASWSHTLAAFLFREFGVSLFTFRFSQALWVIMGLGLVTRSLVKTQGVKTALMFLLLAAFSPALLTNHRFAIEINTFHVFCFGLAFWGMTLTQNKRVFFVAFAAALGITSHLLFLAPVLAFWGLRVFSFGEVSRAERIGWVTLSVFASFYFFRISLFIPEKDKALGLVLLSGCVGLWGIRGKTLGSWRLKGARIFYGVGALGIVLSMPFWDGHWSILTQVGRVFFWGTVGGLVLWLIVLLFLLSLLGPPWFSKARNFEIEHSFESRFLFFTGLLSVSLWAVMVKPTPRYFELLILSLCISASMLLTQVLNRSRFQGAVFLLSYIGLGGGSILVNYYGPLVLSPISRFEDRSFQALGFLKDSSEDFTPKQKVADLLLANGCRFQDIAQDDPRILEALGFLMEKTSPLLRAGHFDDQCFGAPGRIHVVRSRLAQNLDQNLDWIIWENNGLLVSKK